MRTATARSSRYYQPKQDLLQNRIIWSLAPAMVTLSGSCAHVCALRRNGDSAEEKLRRVAQHIADEQHTNHSGLRSICRPAPLKSAGSGRPHRRALSPPDGVLPHNAGLLGKWPNERTRSADLAG